MLRGDLACEGGSSEDCSTTSDRRILFAWGSEESPSTGPIWRSRSLRRRLRSSSRRWDSSRDRRRRASESRAIISDRRALASLCSNSVTRPRNSSLIRSSSLTRVFKDVLSARRLSKVWGESSWRSTADGEGWRSGRDERPPGVAKVLSPRVTLSNMCCGAMLELCACIDAKPGVSVRDKGEFDRSE